MNLSAGCKKVLHWDWWRWSLCITYVKLYLSSQHLISKEIEINCTMIKYVICKTLANKECQSKANENIKPNVSQKFNAKPFPVENIKLIPA